MATKLDRLYGNWSPAYRHVFMAELNEKLFHLVITKMELTSSKTRISATLVDVGAGTQTRVISVTGREGVEAKFIEVLEAKCGIKLDPTGL